MVAEGVMSAAQFAKQLQEVTTYSVRPTCIGHVQRGGSPSIRDRILASQMGYYAVELLEKGIGNRVVVTKDGKVTDYDILEALSMKKSVDMNLLKIAQDIAL